MDHLLVVSAGEPPDNLELICPYYPYSYASGDVWEFLPSHDGSYYCTQHVKGEPGPCRLIVTAKREGFDALFGAMPWAPWGWVPEMPGTYRVEWENVVFSHTRVVVANVALQDVAKSQVQIQ